MLLRPCLLLHHDFPPFGTYLSIFGNYFDVEQKTVNQEMVPLGSQNHKSRKLDISGFVTIYALGANRS